jgi:methyl-accepting chemotaxis protein
VNGAVSEMDKVTQQNAASAEQSSSAASELNGQAEELAAMVGAFQLTRHGGAALKKPAAHARSAALPAPRPQARPVARPAARPAGLPAARRASAAPPADLFPMDEETELRDF